MYGEDQSEVSSHKGSQRPMSVKARYTPVSTHLSGNVVRKRRLFAHCVKFMLYSIKIVGTGREKRLFLLPCLKFGLRIVSFPSCCCSKSLLATSTTFPIFYACGVTAVGVSNFNQNFLAPVHSIVFPRSWSEYAIPYTLM